MLSSICLTPLVILAMQQAAATTRHGAAAAFELQAQSQTESYNVLIPVAAKSARLEHRTAVPSATSAASGTPRLPTPTPTLMIQVAPPSMVYADCTVLREDHRHNSETVTGIIRSEYDASSHAVRQLYDVQAAGGEGADGIVDFRRIARYRDTWLLLENAVYDGELSEDLLSREEYVYDDADRLESVRHDVDGDAVVDKIDTYTYDGRGLLVSVENAGLRIDYSHDDQGRIESEYYDLGNDGTTEFGFQFIWDEAVISGVGYDTNGNGEANFVGARRYDDLQRLVYAEALPGDWEYRYTDEGWVAAITLSKSGAWESTLAYEYDPVGRLTRESFLDHVGDGYYKTYENRCPPDD